MKHSILGLVLLVLAISASAMFRRPDVEKVPVDRLIENLQAQLEQAPKDTQKRYALGRLHAMAFWRGQFEAEQNRRDGQPWFGYCDRFQMPGPRQTKDDSGGAISPRDHLNKAIELLREVTKQDTNHLVARLGLGWCLEQSGDKAKARAEYQTTLNLAWAKEEKQRAIGPCGSLAEETCRYLLPLLDEQKDAAEIKRVQDIQQQLKQMPRAVTPILVPLGARHDLERLIAPQARVRFDLDGSGEPREWGWITPEAAWLVYDHDGRGEITSGLQMLGAVSFWIFWETGYEALATLDDDGNGSLDGNELRGLALWQDANCNGLSEPGEVKPLSAHGVIRLQYNYQKHPTGIPYHPAGAIFADGSSRPTFDWIARTPTKTK